MWAFALPWFRATDKTNYGPMCVHVILIDELMSDEVKSVWRVNRTISLRGHRGRNVAWDYGNERQNCQFKGGLQGFITRERLEEFPVLMNGCKHIAAQTAAALFVDEAGVGSCDQYSHILPEDNASLFLRRARETRQGECGGASTMVRSLGHVEGRAEKIFRRMGLSGVKPRKRIIFHASARGIFFGALLAQQKRLIAPDRPPAL